MTVAFAFLALTAVQAVSPNQFSPSLQARIAAYTDCMRATDGQLRAGRVTPERYELAFEGACFSQYYDVIKEMKSHLDAIPHPGVSYDDAQSITAGTMASIQSSDQRLRKRYVSAYVLWFASAGGEESRSRR